MHLPKANVDKSLSISRKWSTSRKYKPDPTSQNCTNFRKHKEVPQKFFQAPSPKPATIYCRQSTSICQVKQFLGKSTFCIYLKCQEDLSTGGRDIISESGFKQTNICSRNLLSCVHHLEHGRVLLGQRPSQLASKQMHPPGYPFLFCLRYQ